MSGRIVRVNGPLVEIEGLERVAMLELVTLGEHELPGEAVAIDGGRVTAQAYESTGGIRVGDRAATTGYALSAELGPHLLGGVFDGLLRPLQGRTDWLEPSPLRRSEIATERWPIRAPRPFRRRLEASAPLLTGQRVLDLLFPIAKGAAAAVPGGFGTGKTMLLQQILKWCDADVIVFVGCGERGNELADAMADLRELSDPKTGRKLLERTVVIANTSNMPVMAREASIYTGMTVAEYYRDQGKDVVLLADSTSRWAEALREFSSRSGELPAEEGYPAGLSSALAAFYERAGRVQTLAGGEGSVTVIGAVSPAGGDMTEPVTAHTERFVRSLWSLDRDLAYARHYPAVTWRRSFARDIDAIAAWHAASGRPEWSRVRARTITLLAEADRLESVVELVGLSALPARERMVMLAGRYLREGVLQQNALSENDATCAPAKQSALLRAMLDLYDRSLALIESGAPAATIEELDLSGLSRLREEFGPDDGPGVERSAGEILAALSGLA